MGYTRYWKTTGKPFTDEFVKMNKNIVSIAETKFDIVIKNGIGEDKPIINKEKILLNGDAEHGLDHETYCLISEEKSDFEFCKTARKPYDVVVNALLQIANEYGYVKDVRNDGPYNDEKADLLIAEAMTLTT